MDDAFKEILDAEIKAWEEINKKYEGNLNYIKVVYDDFESMNSLKKMNGDY